MDTEGPYRGSPSQLGIRQALGARGADLRRLVLGQSALGGAIGLTAGAVGSLAAVTVLLKALGPARAAAFGTELLRSSEIQLIGLGAATLLDAILPAMYLPARRARNVDPMKALRYE